MSKNLYKNKLYLQMDLYNQLIQAFDLSINPKNQDDIKQAEQFLENVKDFFFPKSIFISF